MKTKDYEIIADGIVAIKKKYPKTQKAKQNLIDEVASSIEFEININNPDEKSLDPLKLSNLIYEKMKK